MTDPTMSKQEREREALTQLLAKKGNVRPPSTDLSQILGADPADPAETERITKNARHKRIAPKPPAVKPAKALTAHKPAKSAKTAPAAKETPPPAAAPVPEAVTPPAPVEAAPWSNAHPKVTSPYLLRLPEEMHMKLAWLSAHLPSTSMNKLMLEAVQQHTEALLSEHYKPGAK